MTPGLHPDIQRLLDLNEELRAQLADLMAHAHDLAHTVRPNLLALYQARLGPWELEKLKAQFRVARLKRMLELTQAALNRGETPDMQRIEAQVREEQVLWEVRLKEAAERLEQAGRLLSSLHTHEDSKELKKLYHQLVKQLHPDLNPGQDHAARRLWQQVQDAYETGDLEGLRALALLLLEEKEPAPGPGALEKLLEENARLEKRVAEAEAGIVEMEAKPPFTMREDLENEVWTAMRRTVLEKEAQTLRDQAEALEKHLSAAVPASHVPDIHFGPN